MGAWLFFLVCDNTPRGNVARVEAFAIIPRTLKFVYCLLVTSAFCANILVVAQTTIISVLGASLALRGRGQAVP